MFVRPLLFVVPIVAVTGCTNSAPEESTEPTGALIQAVVAQQPTSPSNAATARRATDAEKARFTPWQPGPTPPVPTRTGGATPLVSGTTCTMEFDDVIGASYDDPGACIGFMDGNPVNYWNYCPNWNAYFDVQEETGMGDPTYHEFHTSPYVTTNLCIAAATSKCTSGKFGYGTSTCTGISDASIDSINRTLLQHLPDQVFRFEMPGITNQFRPSEVRTMADSNNIDVWFLDWNGTMWVYENLSPGDWTLNSTGTLGQTAWVSNYNNGNYPIIDVDTLWFTDGY